MMSKNEDEKFDLVWRVFSEYPALVDEDTKLEYVTAAKF
jgi:hypothetical protein